ncbi:hypothetical protein CC1G_06387 [Coprinopsis cinerea okayama7|uniref:Uncharacterized protein n=1 Tax=Coprinopsis cinerea (strain Okayama-7 / 130 / ATCC MYA-4618 / FGSC 9003) TaxID=240176 RepID=A8NTU1_COPC7|nr:hypothetical protein CC1G_06387 [Coprinopsis cinerea okayama7\|eukprot:XP_001836302.2 hypothetical protein CC1G_06387 [Coprinopsis cinerea okayama7\
MFDPALRPPSIRSVASNSSITSGLSRRSRTRRRSKTVTGGAPPRPDDIAATPVSELPYLDAPIVNGPFASASSSSSLPIRPPKSPRRPDYELSTLTTATTPSSHGLDLPNTAEVTMVEPLPSPLLGKSPKVTELDTTKLSSAVVQSGYRPPPSAFSRDPAFTPHVRDSISTHQSGTSSSLYPPSTPTTSTRPDTPPTPRSMSRLDYLDHPLSPEIREVKGFDGDDVAYRLQLLVKNNYFLPPAHSKPSPADFAAVDASSGKKPVKSSTPAFLDLFRVVKPKSKPNTPPTASPNPDAPPPMLRTTADSITTGHLLRPQQHQPRTSSQIPRTSPQPRGGRVVVVREKMEDLAVAAKQAEQDLRNKGLDLVQPPSLGALDDVIDPTDAVDVPLPSASYPFAVQASALHGLGVQDSVGAALLADRLPPPKGSNMSSSFDIDDDWRKALLHEAVHHSLDNTPDASFSHNLGASTPVLSGRFRSSSHAPTPTFDRDTPPRDVQTPPQMLTAKPNSREKPRKKIPDLGRNEEHRPAPLDLDDMRRESHSSSVLPPRVITPVGPMTPLAPPPRNRYITQHSSSSQTNLPSSLQDSEPPRSNSAASYHTLRRARSSPLLSDHDALRRGLVMTPPPVPNSRLVSATTMTSYDNSQERPDSITSGSFYTDDDFDDEGLPRHSLALSAVHGAHGRPSLSEYSQSSLSPTTSAFQDALNRNPYYSSSMSSLHHSRVSLEQRDRGIHGPGFPRDSTLSPPPPRMSSSLAHVALPPPPRPRNYPYQHRFVPRPPSDTSSLTEAGSLHGPDDVNETLRFDEPAPTSPGLDGLEQPRDMPDIPRLSLDSDAHHPIVPSINTGNEPPSDTSFFDTIQTQPNAMDDLDSSDEDELPPPLPPPSPRIHELDSRTRAISVTSSNGSRSPLMRQQNHSLPYVARANEASTSSRFLPIGGGGGGSSIPKQGVGNVPPKPQYFADRKSDSGHPMPSVAYSIIQHSQERLPLSSTSINSDHKEALAKPRPATASQAVPSSWKAQESLRKLDGMLLQHMEAEKDTIKRIATTVKQSNPAPPSPFP